MKANQRISRRDMMKVMAGTAATAALAGSHSLESLAAAPDAMPLRPLGHTGHNVRLFSLGGQATLEQEGTHDQSLAIINRAIDLGVNYIDTARIYGGGISETYIGEVMKTRRREVFLASKTRHRDYDGSMRSLETSLATLQTDHLDLWQLHNIMTDEDLDRIFAEDGAIKALERARRQKMVRFLGITGHYDPFVLKRGSSTTCSWRSTPPIATAHRSSSTSCRPR
jgi:aryl-alcohol dehydrogenase-like predicted oxidoreductase